MEQSRLLSALEVTALGFGVDRTRVLALCEEAARRGVIGICVPAVFAAEAVSALRGTGTRAVSVANFPFGDLPLRDVVHQVSRLVHLDGVQEVDVVAPLPLLLAEEWARYERWMRQVVDAAGAPVKVILETAAIGPSRWTHAAKVSAAAGVGWVKTSTGFHPQGGASWAAVRALRAAMPATVGVKASGGIRTRKAALELLVAGADRIGASAYAAILDDAPAVSAAAGSV
ncbi:MAG TPA: deoxyribose-phosphate aldolase [Gemmatimonadaceae bacterium]